MIWTTDQGLRTSSTITINPGVSDNTDWSPSVACSHNSGDAFQLGDTNVTCNATDDSGNTGTCTFMITIQGRVQNVTCNSTDMIQETFVCTFMVKIQGRVQNVSITLRI